MRPRSRPLSPHLQIYQFQLTWVLSILHRFTGIVLFGGAFIWVFCLSGLALGPGAFNALKIFWRSPMGILCLVGWLFSFYYHLLNGIRHLFWDMGKGFDLKIVYLTGWSVVGGSFLFTVLTFLVSS